MRPLHKSLLALTVFASSAQAAIFTVDTTSDDNFNVCTAAAGDCSLRGAITNANALSDSDAIAFDIPAASDPGCVAATGVCRITFAQDLPIIGGTSAGFDLTIDGYTQPGAQPNTVPAPGGLDSVLKIELRPSAPSTPVSGLVLRSPTTVRGLAIGGFMTGIGFFQGSPCTPDWFIHGNYINTDASGTLSVAEHNGVGIRASLGPCVAGVAQIGSAAPADRNLLVASIHGGKALLVDLGSASVEGNLIGSDRSGTVALGGGATGIQVFRVFNTQHVTIGGATPEQGNVIVGASNIGLDLGGGCTTVGPCVVVENNRIGVGSTGGALGNSSAVILAGSGHIRFGGPGRANRVENNKRGVVITAGSRHDIAENHFANNFGEIGGSDFGLGISLAGITHLPNDADDADAGLNQGQNFPEISVFGLNAGNVDLDYRVDSAIANAVYPLRVDFYKAAGDEGQDFIGSDTYLESEAQTFKFISLPLPGGIDLTVNDVIVATATDADGNTSEFSFHTAELALHEPQVVTCAGSSDSLFCNGFEPGQLRNLLVGVTAVATAGPFAPNGVVRVSVGPVNCELTLVPGGDPLTSAGECVLPGLGNPGTLSITAKLSAVRSAFGTISGDHVTVTETYLIPAGFER